jgi:hypothetical protein
MKIILTFGIVFVLVAASMRSARKRGKLNEEANKAVGALADTMRYFLYGLMAFVGFACAAFIYQMF